MKEVITEDMLLIFDFFDKNKKTTKKSTTKKSTTKKTTTKSTKQKKSVNLSKKTKGFFIFLLIIASFLLLFVFKPGGYSLYERITGRGTRTVHSSLTKEQASKITILIDPGHGGFDNGATTSFLKETESELNLEISKKLKEELESVGFNVEITRTTNDALAPTKDADMKKRKDMIYNSPADIVVSIHQNTHQNSGVNGPIVFFMPGSKSGKELADLIQSSMNDELAPKSPKSAQSQNFLVLRSGNMPSILIECGFLTNKTEASRIGNSAYQKRIAQSITWGIMDYFATKI